VGADGADRARRGWRAAWISLTALFLLAAALNMLRVHAGFLTSHLADLVVPAWLYVALRGLAGHDRSWPRARLAGAASVRAALVIFAASTLTEVSQKFWPRGPFRGTYDPLDIVAYAAGTGACLAAELLTRRRGTAAR
jgi:hypothetical protein